MQLCKITVLQVQNFRTDLRKIIGRYKNPLSNKSINGIIGNLRAIMEEAKRLEYISGNPLEDIKDYKIESKEKKYLPQKKLKEHFTDSALDSIWQVDLKMYTINLLAATTGLRMGECQALKASDIDLKSTLRPFLRYPSPFLAYGLQL